MACPCCATVPCTSECSGNGVPQQLSMTISSATFGLNSPYDEDDLPFQMPATFILPLIDPDNCNIWSASFFERDSLCRPCGVSGGFGVLRELGLTVARPLFSPNQVNVQILLATGEPNFFGNCLGVSSDLRAALVADICSLPISGTVTNNNQFCFGTNIATFDISIEAA